jgi:hypothetical protein
VADVKDALEFVEALFFVVKVWGLPSQRVPGGGFEVAFFGHVVLLRDFLWGFSEDSAARALRKTRCTFQRSGLKKQGESIHQFVQSFLVTVGV